MRNFRKILLKRAHTIVPLHRKSNSFKMYLFKFLSEQKQFA